MSQTFFRFGKALFDSNKNEGDLLTDDVEEEDEYDALNDETFGDGALDADWEDDHEKLAECLHGDRSNLSSEGQSRSKFFQEETEEDFDEKLGRSKEIVEQTISHLGMEDDLDDPAVMSRGQSTPRALHSLYGSSAPPPAILDAEECGSPKTQTIWSTSATQFHSTPAKSSQLSSLLHNLHVKPEEALYQMPPFAGRSLSPKASISLTNVHKLEDIERDLLGKSVDPPVTSWPASPKAVTAEQVEKELLSKQPSESIFSGQMFSDNLHKNTWTSPSQQQQSLESHWGRSTPPLPVSGNLRTLNDVENDILLRPRAHTLDEVERNLQQNSRLNPPPGFSTPTTRGVIGGNRQPPIGTPPQGGGIFPMAGASQQLRSSPVSIVPLSDRSVPVVVPSPLGSQMSTSLPLHPILNPGRPMGPVGGLPHNTFGNFNKNIFPFGIRGPRATGSGVGPPPLMNQNFSLFGRGPAQRTDRSNGRYWDADEYEGIMTQKEKEWLIRIQMLQLHTDNPYVDDYYHTTYIMRKMTREKSKSLCEDEEEDDDEVKLIVPERSKQESRTYVPLQFEGSLGKLQAVSVNFPRRILDVHHMRTEEESRMPANKELHKQRRLLLDIEKLYTVFLNVDDQEKRILALPEDAQGPHKEARCLLIEKLFAALFCNDVEERFVQIASIRKGRHLVMRSIPLFDRERQITAYSVLFGNVSHITRRDRNDLVLPQYLRTVKKMIAQCSFEELVKLAIALRGESLPSREWSNYLAALQTKFVLSCLCNMINKAEQITKVDTPIRNDLQSHWTNFVVHVVNAICSMKESAMKPPDSPPVDILQHIRRYPIAQDKLEAIKDKLKLFGFD